MKVYRAEWMEENLDALLGHEELKFYAMPEHRLVRQVLLTGVKPTHETLSQTYQA